MSQKNIIKNNAYPNFSSSKTSGLLSTYFINSFAICDT